MAPKKFLIAATGCCVAESQRPNIVFMMADDMGWNDVSFHGSDQILTPNIDALAYHGAVLQQYYSEPICTPARAALLTGKYPEKVGMQSMPLFNSEDRGIPLQERLLPQYLKELGYSTHLVGKWHVGMSRHEYLPLSRGFDTHFGMRGGFVDAYTYAKNEEWPDGRMMTGLDMWDGNFPLEDENQYLTDLLTDRAIQIIHQHNKSRPLFLNLAHGAPHAGNAGSPLSTPPSGVSRKNRHIAYSDRRLYAEIVRNLDYNIGRVVETLATAKMLDNTIIVFVSDNGAPTLNNYANWGVNLPFRGIKQTPWEGSVRVPALLWHSSMNRPGKWTGLMHITDWLPTLLSAAGSKPPKDIDGVDQWKSILQNKVSRRNEILITLDDMDGYAAYRLGDYKLVIGNLSGSVKDDYCGKQFMALRSSPPPYLNVLMSCDTVAAMEAIGHTLDIDKVLSMRESFIVRQSEHVRDANLCIPKEGKGCLFNVVNDPQEGHDIWDKEPSIVATIIGRLKEAWNFRKPRNSLLLDERADPAMRRYVWVPWLSNDGNLETFIFPRTPASAFDSKKPTSDPTSEQHKNIQYIYPYGASALNLIGQGVRYTTIDLPGPNDAPVFDFKTEASTTLESDLGSFETTQRYDIDRKDT